MKKIVGLVCSFVLIFCILFSGGCADNRPIDAYFIKIEYKNDLLICKMQYNFELKKDGEVVFNLYPNTYEEDDQGIKITSIKNNQRQIEWKIFGDNAQFLSVDLSGYKKGDNLQIDFEFETAVPPSFSRHGRAEEVVNLAYFYPIACVCENEEYQILPFTSFGDPFYSDFANYTVEITLPSVMSVAAGGEPKGISVSGEQTTYLYQIDNAKTFALSFSDKYHVICKKYNEKRINYFYYNDINAEQNIEEIASCLEFLEKNCFSYPYSCLTIAQSAYQSGGMEYPAFCVVGESKNEKAYLYAIIHEVCHQIFPITLSVNEYQSGYFDEGITEFLTASFFNEKRAGVLDTRAIYWNAFVNAYKKSVDKQGIIYDGIMKKPHNELNKEQYLINAYYKGFLLFYKLNKSGENLYSVIKKLYKRNRLSQVTEQDFFKAVKSERKVKSIFEEIVYQGGDISLD